MGTNPELAQAIAAVLAAAQGKPADQPQIPELLTVKETAKILRCGKTLVYAMLQDGRLPVVKVGRRRLVRADDVQRLLSGKPR